MDSSKIEAPYFWQALQLYLQKAHVVNRRLAAVVNIGCAELKQFQDEPHIFEASCLINHNSTAQLDAGEFHIEGEKIMLSHPDGDHFLAIDLHETATAQGFRFLVLVNRLLAKNMSVFFGCHEIVVIGKCVIFVYKYKLNILLIYRFPIRIGNIYMYFQSKQW